jgi:hypothetical protein
MRCDVSAQYSVDPIFCRTDAVRLLISGKRVAGLVGAASLRWLDAVRLRQRRSVITSAFRTPEAGRDFTAVTAEMDEYVGEMVEHRRGNRQHVVGNSERITFVIRAKVA